MARSAKAAPAAGREKILDAAEQLFASDGYYGASLREITREAGVELGLASYHFRSKDELYRQVLLRRASDMARELDDALIKASSTRAQTGEAVRAILSAYVMVHVDKLHSTEPGWRSYVRLAAQAALLLQSVKVTSAAAEIYDPVLRRYKAALTSELKVADPAVLDRHFYVFQMALLGIALDMSEMPRVVRDHRSDDELARTIIDIFTAAFLASRGK